jgi:hypothetical protein
MKHVFSIIWLTVLHFLNDWSLCYAIYMIVLNGHFLNDWSLCYAVYMIVLNGHFLNDWLKV